jgi:hypothetical protein
MVNALRLLLALTFAAALVSCGGDDSSPPPSLEPAVANQLAQASDEVAAALEQHRCAEPTARELERKARAETVPVAVRQEIGRVIARARISCPAVAPPPVPVPTIGEDEGEDGGRGRGHEKHENHQKEKKHGHGHGNEGGSD